MLFAIVTQGQVCSREFLSIEGEQVNAGRISGVPGDGDVIHRLPIAVVDLAGIPCPRQSGIEPKLIADQVDRENRQQQRDTGIQADPVLAPRRGLSLPPVSPLR